MVPLPGPETYASDAPQPEGLLCNPKTLPRNFVRSSFRRQVPPRPSDARDPSSENRGRELSDNLAYHVDFHATCRDLLHAANLRHGTDDFTSPPKEVVLRIFFSPLKIRRLPPTWVLKTSTLNPRPSKPLIFILEMIYLTDVKVTFNLEQATKAQKVINLCTRWGWVVSTTARPLYLREKPSTHCTAG
jgi:hypothetical protein